MLAINTSVSKNTQKTPYELVFGQPPRHDQEFWQSILNQTLVSSSNIDSIINEEDIIAIDEEQENVLGLLIW